MACVALDADEVRAVADVTVLQSRGILERVCGHHTVVVVGGGHQDGRILLAVLDGMQRGVLVEVLEHLLAVLAGAVIHRPVAADGELVVAEHIHNAHLRDGHRKEVGTLVHDCADEQAAVGTALQGQLLLARIFLVDEVFRRRDAVVEYVLLLHLGTGLVPFLAVFAAAAQVHDSQHAALLQPGDPRRAETRGERDVEAAVPVEQRRVVAVHLDALLVGDEHRDLGAVLRGEELLLGHVFVGVELDLGLLVERGFVVGDVIAVDGRRGDVGGHGVERLRILRLAAESADSADHVVVEVAEELAALVENLHERTGVLGVVGNQPVADMAHTREHLPLGGGDDVRPPHRVETADRDADDLVLRGVVVGHHEEMAVNLVNDGVVIREVGHGFDELRFRIIQIFVIQRIAGCGLAAVNH